jgi:hypothetical protein
VDGSAPEKARDAYGRLAYDDRSMTLLLEVAAFVIVGLLLVVFTGTPVARQSVLGALGVVAVALAYFFFWTHVWAFGRVFTTEHDRWVRLSPQQVASYGGSVVGTVDIGFTEWLRRQIPAGSTFYLAQTSPPDDGRYQWITYRLLPDLAVDNPARAAWIVFYDVDPRGGRYAGVAVEGYRGYKAHRGLARVRNAS